MLRHLHPVERLLAQSTLVLLAVCLVLIVWKGTAIGWGAYGACVLLSAAAVAGGLYYRLRRNEPALANALIGVGLFSPFSFLVVVFNYLQLPISGPTIDPTLIAIDAALGFHWPHFVAWFADWPLLSLALKAVYASTLFQMITVIVVLAFVGRTQRLHATLLSVMLTSVAIVAFWTFLPSLGTTVHFPLPAAVEAAVQPFVGTSYGVELLRIAANGPALIHPAEVKGLIAFPSYHIGLACICTWAMRDVAGWRWVFLTVNAAMFPATVLHGGHHLIDLPGGVVLFVLGTLVVARLMPKLTPIVEADAVSLRPASGEGRA